MSTCYLCHLSYPQNETEVRLHTVASFTRGGTVEGVKRYVRMCRVGYGCKRMETNHEAKRAPATCRVCGKRIHQTLEGPWVHDQPHDPFTPPIHAPVPPSEPNP